jgi:hypothetical protein
MRVVCIDNCIYPELEVGKIYQAKVIFFLQEEGGISELDWKDNYLTLDGYTEIDWYKTEYFITIDKWRDLQIKQLGV